MLHAALTAPSLDELSPRADRERIDRILSRFFRDIRQNVRISDHLEPLFDRMVEFVLRGGKRLRPRLCLASYRILSGQTARRGVWRAAGSLEIFHAFMLIHDDLIDNSILRRDQPALHEAIRMGRTAESAERAARVGRDLGLLAGDLLCSMGMRLVSGSGLEPSVLARVTRQVSEMLMETGLGEALDVLYEGVPLGELSREQVEEAYVRKTACYSVSGPLMLGALMARAEASVVQALGDFGDRLGLGYQIQNDLDALAEPPGEADHDDLDAGKRTWVLWKAYQDSDCRGRARIEAILQAPVSRERRCLLYDEIVRSGALEAGRDRLAELRRESLALLRQSPLNAEQRRAFLSLAALFARVPASEAPPALEPLPVSPVLSESRASL